MSMFRENPEEERTLHLAQESRGYFWEKEDLSHKDRGTEGQTS